MEFEKKIRRINILKKLLDQEAIALKKNLGDPADVAEINTEVKAFVKSLLEKEFGVAEPAASGTFESQETAVLKEMARRVLTKSSPEQPAQPSAVRISPILMAHFASKGLDPSTMTQVEIAKEVKEYQKGLRK